MEIFKLFNPDWPSVSARNTSAKCANCDLLNKQLQEKHEVLLTLINKGNDVQKQLQECQEKEMEMQVELQELRNSNDDLLIYLDEYDRLLQQVVADRNHHKSDTDLVTQHLKNLEFSFSDVHSKYERAKSILEGYRENEIVLLESVKENERTIIDLQNKYETLKENSIMNLNEANETLNNMQQEHEETLNAYRTKMKMLELTIHSLEGSLEQKICENEKLSSICDEFIKGAK